MCEQTDKSVLNTDRELWRADVKDYPADTLFMTEGNGIGMNCKGDVVVMSLAMWCAVYRAVKHIADQNTIGELSAADEDCEGDFEGAYDTIIEECRKALGN